MTIMYLAIQNIELLPNLDREDERSRATQGGSLRQSWTERAHAAAAADNK